MKKVFKLRDLDCANCARKMEDAIRKIDGVEDVQVSFLTQKLTLTAEDERLTRSWKRRSRPAAGWSRTARSCVKRGARADAPGRRRTEP